MKKFTEDKTYVLPKCMERGSKLIYRQRGNEWAQYFKEKPYGDYAYLTEVVDVMEALDQGVDMELVLDSLNTINFTGNKYFKFLNIVTVFSKRGTEFYKALYKDNISEEAQTYLDIIEEENEAFANNFSLKDFYSSKYDTEQSL